VGGWLADDRRIMPIEKLGYTLEAPESFCLAISYNRFASPSTNTGRIICRTCTGTPIGWKLMM